MAYLAILFILSCARLFLRSAVLRLMIPFLTALSSPETNSLNFFSASSCLPASAALKSFLCASCSFAFTDELRLRAFSFCRSRLRAARPPLIFASFFQSPVFGKFERVFYLILPQKASGYFKLSLI